MSLHKSKNVSYQSFFMLEITRSTFFSKFNAQHIVKTTTTTTIKNIISNEIACHFAMRNDIKYGHTNFQRRATTIIVFINLVYFYEFVCQFVLLGQVQIHRCFNSIGYLNCLNICKFIHIIFYKGQMKRKHIIWVINAKWFAV